MPQAMAYPASRGHAGRGNDDRRRAWLVQPHRRLCAVRCVQGGEVHEARRQVRTGVLTHRRAATDVQGFQGHGAVYVHGYRRYVAPGRQLAERVQNQLGAVHRESWNEDRSFSAHRAADGRSQDFVAGDAVSWMSTVAVGRLDDHRGLLAVPPGAGAAGDGFDPDRRRTQTVAPPVVTTALAELRM
jgi:hypothetical protein